MTKSSLILYSAKFDRWFDFRFIEPFGRPFSQDFAATCLRELEHGYARTTAETHHRKLARSLGWVAARPKVYPELFSAVAREYRTVAPALWQRAMDDWASQHSDSEERSRGTAGGQIVQVNTMWARLLDVVPKIEPLVVPRDYRASLGRRRTVAEVPPPAPEVVSNRRVGGVDKTLGLLPLVHRTKPRTEAAVAAVVVEAGGAIPTLEQLEEKLIALPAARLQTIRAEAEAFFSQAYGRFREAQDLIQQRLVDADRICLAYWAEWDHRLWGNPPGAVNALKTMKPWVTHSPYGNPLTDEQFLGNLLVFLDREFRGFVPSQQEFPSFHGRYILKSGGTRQVQAYLCADAFILIAALVIILIDCAWNPSTGLSLKVDCIRGSNRPGHFEIVGFKPRSGAAQVATLRNKPVPPQRLTVKKVVAMVLEMTARARAIADPETAERLLIYRSPIQAKASERGIFHLGGPEGDTPHKVFKRLQQRWGWANAPYTLDQFRSSGAVAMGSTAGDVVRVQTTLGHSQLDTTRQYLDHVQMELRWEAQIRSYQNDFQLIALREVDGVAKQLGVTVQDFTERLQHALRNGRGLLCADPYAGFQPGTKAGDLCTKVENCWSCPQSFFVATVENTADLILWSRHVRRGADLKYLNPHLWYEEWAPWFILTEVLVEKVKKEMPETYEDAVELAEELQAGGQVHFRALA